MEEQPADSTTRTTETAASTASRPTTPRSGSISSSEPTLRFPRPQGNRQLASWISSSHPDIMHPSNLTEESHLADSTFELINTDDESQDGRATESISSFDYARADDVHSLAGTEQNTDDAGDRTDTDSEAEDEEALNRSRASSIQYAEQSLESPSSRVATPVDYEATSEAATPLIQSIEFQENESLMYLKKVSVKHAIRDFNADESATLLAGLNISDPPKRLIGTIRQTMAQSCLSTREPLRILYVGSLVARHDIIYKISSALMASSYADRGSDDDGIFNVVPISSFGSPKEPEVELMRTSQYQIKVDVCTSAKEIVYEGENFPGDTVYSITVDDRTYKSAFCPSGSVIEPAWTLPHVAIFYVTDNDDLATQQTRDATWEFMTRHSVPSIFISNSQSFAQPQSPASQWRKFVDQHAVHLCLESRDSTRPISPVRLPIDLSSFLNIDARQMNRNLAYLTGLYEPLGVRATQEESTKTSYVYAEWMKTLRHLREGLSDQYTAVLSAIFLVLGGLVGMFLVNYIMMGSGIPTLSGTTAPTCFHTGTTVQSRHSQASSMSVSTSTITINLTSTKTIRVPHVNASPSNTAVMPFKGFLSDAHDPQKGNLCSTEVYGKNEILVKIPRSTKTSWLAKDSITIDVFRGDEPIKTKFSSIDEGILIEIPSKEAYGILNVSVNTTRKPKVNETFDVDFGKGKIGEALDFGKVLAQELASKLTDAANEAAKRVEESLPVLESMKDTVVARAMEAGEVAQALSVRFGTQAANHVKDSWNPDALAKRWREAQDEVAKQLRHAEDLTAQLDLSILKAQIASKLWWLKVQKKTDEHDNYQKKADSYLAKKHQVAAKARKERLSNEKKDLRARRKKERLEARCQSGFSRWTNQCKQQA